MISCIKEWIIDMWVRFTTWLKTTGEMPKVTKYGWIPSVPDIRDWQFSKSLVYSMTAPVLPPSVDLRSGCSIVEDQGQLGSCTANALVGALEFLEKKNKKSYTDYSRLFLYYNGRAIEFTTRSDSGAQLRDGIKSLRTKGICTEQEWPYDISKFKVRPSCKCYKNAVKNVITAYYNIKTLQEMKSCLAQGFPFVFGFAVYESFETAEVANTGIANLPGPNEKKLGGHAVLCVGYDDATQRFLVRNSWGENWGQHGYFTMPYQYLTNPNLASDFWFITADRSF